MSNEETPVLEPGEKWRIIRNVLVISVGFMLNLSGFYGASNLQSSIFAEAGLGTAALAAVYAGIIFANIFINTAVIKWCSTKWTICLGLVLLVPYLTAQLHPRFYTMVPAGFLLGVGAGPMWCAKCVYMSVASESYSKITKGTTKAQLVRFLGLFFTIGQLARIWGSLISSTVLTSDNKAAVTTVNATMISEVCGANFLPNADAARALPTQPPEKIQMLVGIFVACCIGSACIVAIGVDSMKRYAPGRSNSATGSSGLAFLSVTMKLLVSEPKQLLMLPITFYLGVEQAFFSADFTAAFVSCTIGTGSVGYVVMAHGITDALACALTGSLAKITGRLSLMCCAAILNAAVFITMVVWRPRADMAYVLYIMSSIWGLFNSMMLVLINAYYGTLFPGKEEAAYSNFRLWDSVGYVAAYLVSPYLRTVVKTYLMFTVMIIGIIGYFIVEYKERDAKNRLHVNKNDNLRSYDNAVFDNDEK